MRCLGFASVPPAVAAAVCLALCVQAGTGHAQRELPAFEVDGRQYQLKELIGVTEAEMKEQFLADVAELSDAELRSFLPVPIQLQLPDAPKPPTDRKSLEDAAFIGVRDRLLDQAAMYLTLAAIGDRFVRDFGIDVDEYFDISALEDARQRATAATEFTFVHSNEPPTNAQALHGEAVKRFRITLKSDAWGDVQSLVHRHRPLRRWIIELMRRSTDRGLNAYGVNMLLTHYLVKDACENGIYRERAEAYCKFQFSLFQVIELNGFGGQDELLMLLASDLADDAGRLRPKSATSVRRFIGRFPQFLAVTTDVRSGRDLSEGWTLPPVGAFYQVGAERYRLLASVRAPSPEMWQSSTNRIAYQMATAPWLPTLRSFRPTFLPDVERYASAVATSATRHVVSDVEVDPFVKKPVPGAIFREWEEERGRLAELVAEAAHVMATQDENAMRQVLGKIDQRIAVLETEPARNAYRAIKARLEAGG